MQRPKRRLPGESKKQLNPFHLFVSSLLAVILILMLAALVSRMRDFQSMQQRAKQLKKTAIAIQESLHADLIRTILRHEQCGYQPLHALSENNTFELWVANNKVDSQIATAATAGSIGLSLPSLQGVTPGMLLQICYQQQTELLLINKMYAAANRVTFVQVPHGGNQLLNDYPEKSLIRSIDRVRYSWQNHLLERQSKLEGQRSFAHVGSFQVHHLPDGLQFDYELIDQTYGLKLPYIWHWRPWFLGGLQ